MGLAAKARAQADFAGRTVVLTVPEPQGGGSGTIAQFLAPLLTRHLAGHPVVSIDYEPGAGSIRGANRFAAHARANGLDLLMTTGSTHLPYLLGDPRVRYDYKNWRIVMVVPTGGVVYASPELGIGSARDVARLREKRLTFANQGATSLDLVPLLAFRLLGLDVQHVFGYKGRADGRRAFERKAVNLDYQTTAAYLRNVRPLVAAGRAVPLFSWGVLGESGQLVRDPTFPDLPHFGEVYEMLNDRPPAGPDYDAFLAIFTIGFPAQKMVFVPRLASDDVVFAYQAAFAAIRDDPDYQARAAEVLGVYELATGKAAESLLLKSTQLSARDRTTVTTLLASEYGVRLAR